MNASAPHRMLSDGLAQRGLLSGGLSFKAAKTGELLFKRRVFCPVPLLYETAGEKGIFFSLSVVFR